MGMWDGAYGVYLGGWLPFFCLLGCSGYLVFTLLCPLAGLPFSPFGTLYPLIPNVYLCSLKAERGIGRSRAMQMEYQTCCI